jgi:YidC/Oxa1 family membrane protein insertase
MERRVLLAISLSFMVLFLYQALLVPPRPAQPANNTPPAAMTVAAPPGRTLTPGNESVEAAIVPPPPVAAVVGDAEAREIVVETQKIRAVFTNRGARIRHWHLKDFKNGAGEPIDLIPETTAPDTPLPFSLRMDDATTTARLNDGLYRVSGVSGGSVDATAQSATIAFDLETVDGLKARKVFVLEPATYVVQFSANVEQAGQQVVPTIDWGPGLGDEIARASAGSFLSPLYLYKAQAIYQPMGEDVEREAGNALGAGVVREGQYRWAGIDDHYFIAAALQPPGPTRVEYLPVTIPTMGTPPQVGNYVAYAVRFPAPPENVRFYFGPKQLDTLRAIDPEFTRAIYFGIFAWLAAPLLDALKRVQGYVGNWGWSIIVLTILINLALAPLRHKSVVSMRKMQELQPQMKAIQERYAKYKITDPERQKMNTEVMALYKERGVNPASGCVPMLLTMPFLFAFYAMLGQAIEIRGADFWWIRDLASADPFYITPLLMGASMFWQQKITPTTADPTQQKIMMFMPIMIAVTMLFAPAGLVIYWLVSNMWSIGQQYFTNAMLGPPRLPAVATVTKKK